MGSADHLRIYQPRLIAVWHIGVARCTAVDHGLLVVAKKSDEGSYEDPILKSRVFFSNLNDPRRNIRLIAGGRGSRSMPRYTRSLT